MALLIIAYAVFAIAFVAWFALSIYSQDGLVWVAGGFIVLVIAIFPVAAQVDYNYQTFDRHEVTCQVTDKDRGGDKQGTYRVYTDCGVFAVKDSYVNNLWNSADTWAHVQVGSEQTFEVVGWRNGFFSTFPNIVAVK